MKGYSFTQDGTKFETRGTALDMCRAVGSQGCKELTIEDGTIFRKVDERHWKYANGNTAGQVFLI